MRERILKHFEPIVGIIPDEQELFYLVCDLWDFCELISKIEADFNIRLTEADEKDEFTFETVKEFVDWAEEIIKLKTK